VAGEGVEPPAAFVPNGLIPENPDSELSTL